MLGGLFRHEDSRSRPPVPTAEAIQSPVPCRPIDDSLLKAWRVALEVAEASDKDAGARRGAGNRAGDGEGRRRDERAVVAAEMRSNGLGAHLSTHTQEEAQITAVLFSVASPKPLLCTTPIIPPRLHDVSVPPSGDVSHRMADWLVRGVEMRGEEIDSAQRTMHEVRERAEKLEGELRAWKVRSQQQQEAAEAARELEQRKTSELEARLEHAELQLAKMQASLADRDQVVLSKDSVIADLTRRHQGELTRLAQANCRIEELENEVAHHQRSTTSTMISREKGVEEAADRIHACERLCGFVGDSLQVQSHALECRNREHSREHPGCTSAAAPSSQTPMSRRKVSDEAPLAPPPPRGTPRSSVVTPPPRGTPRSSASCNDWHAESDVLTEAQRKLITATITLERGPNGKLGMSFGNTQPGPYTVVALSSQGAAFRSGLLHEGDLIHAIDFISIYQLNLEQVSRLLCGPPGSAVCLEISSQ